MSAGMVAGFFAGLIGVVGLIIAIGVFNDKKKNMNVNNMSPSMQI